MKVIKEPEDQLKDWNLEVTCENPRCNAELLVDSEDIETEKGEVLMQEDVNLVTQYFITCPCCGEKNYIYTYNIPEKIREEIEERKNIKKKGFWSFLFL